MGEIVTLPNGQVYEETEAGRIVTVQGVVFEDTTGGVSISSTLTGTAAAGIDEDNITLGNDTVILTVTGDTFVTGSSSEDGIAGGSNSDKSGATKWNTLISGALDNTDVVLSVGNTVATITLPPFGTYDTDETETITWTIPAASLTTSTSAIIAVPTFTIDEVVSGFQAAWARGSNIMIQGGVQ